jgi:hypothetical protein
MLTGLRRSEKRSRNEGFPPAMIAKPVCGSACSVFSSIWIMNLALAMSASAQTALCLGIAGRGAGL